MIINRPVLVFFIFSAYFFFSVVWLLVGESLEGSVKGVPFLAVDSALYMSLSQEGDNLVKYFFIGTNFLPILLGAFSDRVLGIGDFSFILFFNSFLMFFSFCLFSRMCARVDLLALFWCLNPMVFFVTTSLNKEVFCFFSVSVLFFSLFHCKGGLRFFYCLFALLVAYYSRKYLFYVEVVFLGFYLFGLTVGFFSSLLGFSFFISILMLITDGQLIGGGYGSVIDAPERYGMQSEIIFKTTTQLYDLPGGYSIAFFVHAVINLFSPLLNPKYWSGFVSYVNLSEIFLYFSSLSFFVVMGLCFIKKRVLGVSFLHFFVYIYMFVFCVVPISQHRYFLLIYPLIVMLVAGSHRCRALYPKKCFKWGRFAWLPS